MNEMNLLLAASAIETYKFILQIIIKIGLKGIGSIPTLGSCSSIKSICHSCRSIRRDFWLFGQAMVQMSDWHRGTENAKKKRHVETACSSNRSKLTNFSSGSNFKYLWMNRMTQLSCFSWSTVHFRFFIIGTFPVAFSNISTETMELILISNQNAKLDYNLRFCTFNFAIGIVNCWMSSC